MPMKRYISSNGIFLSKHTFQSFDCSGGNNSTVFNISTMFSFTEMQPHMYNNVILTGGNCRIPGFYDRM